MGARGAARRGSQLNAMCEEKEHGTRNSHGNAVVEFLLVPLILLPLLLVIARAVGIERAQLQLTSAGRDLQRCAALVDSLSQTQLHAIALEMLTDNDIASTAAVTVSTTTAGRKVNMTIRVDGLLPNTTTVLKSIVIVT